MTATRIDFHVTVERIEGERLRVLVNDDEISVRPDNERGRDEVGEALVHEIEARLQGPAEPRHGGHVG